MLVIEIAAGIVLGFVVLAWMGAPSRAERIASLRAASEELRQLRALRGTAPQGVRPGNETDPLVRQARGLPAPDFSTWTDAEIAEYHANLEALSGGNRRGGA